MGIDLQGMRDRKAAQIQAYQQQQDEHKIRQDALKQERMAIFYNDLRTEFKELLNRGTAKVVWANGKLSYSPGADGTSKNDLYNKFKRIAGNKNLPLDHDQFNALYNE